VKVKAEMREWQKKCEEPINFDVFVVNKLQQLDRQKKRKEEF